MFVAVEHSGMDVVYYAKIGEQDKHRYYIYDIPGKWLPTRGVYRLAPRFLSTRSIRLAWFRRPYTEYKNKVFQEMDPLWVGSASHWVP